ncbi:2'-5' RNA ligase family protein [Phenylobacterium sp.]|uniref:2'-5' RNA ligase family protein n=1 Tax=Phenylobacterium sp. TaxID=1871053 RepID=UPI002C410634|nr:2'-5' RNA ligase family protein [Phenylobacterium sp.]HVI32983.1 2'-5' RNA ligase family protein [Phenylobacterium sp.]
MPTRRVVYFALQPDPPVATAAVRLAARLAAENGLGAAPVPAGRLHVSLNGLGEDPDERSVARACDAVSALRVPPFRIAFNRAGSFAGAGKRPLVLWGDEGVIGVERLHAAIHLALAGWGLAPGRVRAFEPHMTLLWTDREVAPAWLETPLAWTARAVVLLESLQGVGRQSVLGRWPLA